MNQEEFEGELVDLPPSKLIDEKKADQFQSFFLILGMIFNDLKGLLMAREIIQKQYRTPESEEISAHAGEYHGLIVQNNKLLLATVGEFFVFLKENHKVIASPRFLLLLKKIDQKTQREWNDLVNPEQAVSSAIPKIARIRSNIVFHFDHSTEELRRGFLRSFFSDQKKLIHHKHAYLSFGKDMKSTRFYFSDAAVDEYMKSLLSSEDIENIGQVISNINSTIRDLLIVYVKSLK